MIPTNSNEANGTKNLASDTAATNKSAEDDEENLKEFLDKFLEKTRRVNFKKRLNDELTKLFIGSLPDLLSLNGSDWEILVQKLGPVITKDLKSAVERKKKSKKWNLKLKSAAEILGDVHKVKRFLLYEANMLDELEKLSQLDKHALALGFDEQKKDKLFDGGPILSEIKSCLEDFTKPYVQFSKPSHGMILVII